MKTTSMFFFQNNELKQSFLLELIDFDSVESIYEVIRIMNGVPLFIEKHLERFNHSANLAGVSKSFDVEEINTKIIGLARKNQISSGNVKLVYIFDNKSLKISRGDLFIYFIPYHYPDSADYQNGISLISLIAERPNPNAKIHHADLRNLANTLIDNENTFEVLLVNKGGFVTEGSRSNIFLIEHNKVVTPPLDVVLPGITRDFTIQICKMQHIDFEEKMVHYEKLNSFKAAFITGTSPKILPVSNIDNFTFDPQNEILQRVHHIYDEMILKYVRNFNSSGSESLENFT